MYNHIVEMIKYEHEKKDENNDKYMEAGKEG
jgi:hypothetical protein